MPKTDDLIFRVRSLIRAFEGEEGLAELDHTSQDILMYIGQAEVAGNNVRASDIASNPSFGSPAKIYGRLSKLAEGGWIKLVSDPKDGRVKLLVPSNQTRGAFNRMSASLKSYLRTT